MAKYESYVLVYEYTRIVGTLTQNIYGNVNCVSNRILKAIFTCPKGPIHLVSIYDPTCPNQEKNLISFHQKVRKTLLTNKQQWKSNLTVREKVKQIFNQNVLNENVQQLNNFCVRNKLRINNINFLTNTNKNILYATISEQTLIIG